MISPEYQQKDSWPHVFMKTDYTKEDYEKIATKYACYHCHLEWWDNAPRPGGRCPARNDKREHKRLGVD